MSVHEKMTAIAGNIRKYGGAPQGTLLNLDQMAQGVTNVHDAGYAVGIAQGKQEQYDLFWDAFQQNGTRTDYLRAFTGYNFTINSFYPKYDINLTGYCTHAFYGWGAKSGGHLDLKSRLEECGVKLDTSKATDLTQMFMYCSNITQIPTIDCTGLTNASNHMFSYTYGGLKKIEKVITKESVTYNYWFADTYLEEITFEGVIGQNIDFSTCPLTKASIENIIEHLSTTSSGKTLTLKQTAVNAAFTTAEFEALKATRTNWTFSLV